MCAKHILENWKKSNKDIELERMFWKISRSYTMAEYVDNLKKMKAYNPGAYESLLKQVPSTFSRPFFKLGSCCNDNLNNLSESFNKTIRESRRKPILDMLEDIRRKCMERNGKRSIISMKYTTPYTPKVDIEIENNRQKARDCRRYISTGSVHEIDYHGDAYTVDMVQKTCGCGYWQLNGIPCMHAMCVITTLRLPIQEYVSSYYTTKKWQELYACGIVPVQGMKFWPCLGRLPVLPPPARCKDGRPNNYDRSKAPSESTSKGKNKRRMTCLNCLYEGHTKKT